eukprot:4876716-Prymnesium_polylepis.1
MEATRGLHVGVVMVIFLLYRTHTPRTPTCAQRFRACDAHTLRAQSQPQRADDVWTRSEGR